MNTRHAMPDDQCQVLLAQARALVLDVDGTLTTGAIIYDSMGNQIMEFHVHDGLGIRMLQSVGIPVAVVTGRGCPALRKRLAELDVTAVWENVGDKTLVLDPLCQSLGVDPGNLAFMGDDLPDRTIMKRVGIPIAVANAHPLVMDAACWVTRNPGGKGAVREACEAVIQARGLWDEILPGFCP